MVWSTRWKTSTDSNSAWVSRSVSDSPSTRRPTRFGAPSWTAPALSKTSTSNKTSLRAPARRPGGHSCFLGAPRRAPGAEDGPLQDRRQEHNEQTPKHVVPEEPNPPEGSRAENCPLADERRPEGGSSLHSVKEKPNEKDTQHRAIEERPKNVYRLDEVVQERSKGRKAHCHQTPNRSGQSRHQ